MKEKSVFFFFFSWTNYSIVFFILHWCITVLLHQYLPGFIMIIFWKTCF